MTYFIIAIVVVALVVVAAAALVMMAFGAALILAIGALGWAAWHVLGLRRPAALADRHEGLVRRLTDHYVAGHIDLPEFERQVERVLARR